MKRKAMMDDTKCTDGVSARCNTNRHETADAALVLTAMGTGVIEEKKPQPYIALEEEDEDDFEIPQRFTKSGRKRAVSFPLKVSSSSILFFSRDACTIISHKYCLFPPRR